MRAKMGRLVWQKARMGTAMGTAGAPGCTVYDKNKKTHRNKVEHFFYQNVEKKRKAYKDKTSECSERTPAAVSAGVLSAPRRCLCAEGGVRSVESCKQTYRTA